MHICFSSPALRCKVALTVRQILGPKVRCWIAPPFEREKHITVYVETNNTNWGDIPVLYLKLFEVLEKRLEPFRVDLMLHPFNSKTFHAILAKRRGIRLI